MASAAAIGAIIGAGKAAIIDRNKEDRQRQLKVDLLRFGPLAGNTSEIFNMQIQEADIIGSGLKGAQFGFQQDKEDEKAGKKSGASIEEFLKSLGLGQSGDEAVVTPTTGTSSVNTTGGGGIFSRVRSIV